MIAAMRALVTGASGYLGTTLLERVPEGTEAVGAGHSRQSDFRWDVTDPDSVRSEIERVAPEVVIHTAAMSMLGACTREPELAFSINADGAGNVAAAARTIGARLVALSTDYVFDGTKGSYSEDDPVAPVNAYGRSKSAGEDLTFAHHPQALIVRTSAMVGADRSDRLPFSSFLLDRGEVSLDLYYDERRSFVPVTTMADAVWALAASDHSGLLHVAGAEASTRVEFARALFGAAEVTGIEITESPSPPGRAKDLSLDVSKASELLPFTLPTLADTVAETIADRARTPA